MSEVEEQGTYSIRDECKKSIMRVAELSSDDFHLDRHLYFSCREDRERFCEHVSRDPTRHRFCVLMLTLTLMLCSFLLDSSRRRKGLQVSVQPQV